MRALVTGAAGFVGTHLVAHLASSGDEVVGADREGGRVDITDRAAVAAMLDEARPQAVYHLAGFSDVGESWNRPAEVFAVNATGTQNVLLAARDAGVERVLVVSSAEIYGRVTEDELPLTEDSPLRPVSPYAASKVAADFLGLQAALGYGLGVLRVRAFNHLGPGQTGRFAAAALASRVASNEVDGSDEVPVGNLAARRDFTDVRDIVRAYRLLVLHGEPGAAYNVCSGHDVAVEEMGRMLIDMAAHPMRLVPDPDLVRPVDLPVLRGDASRLHTATGWKPEIPLERTLADLLEQFRARARAHPPGAARTCP